MSEPQAAVGFTAFARARVDAMLQPSGQTRPRDANDDAWFDAFNHYLKQSGKPPLGRIAQQLPTSFHRHIAEQFESRALTATATSFNAGAGTQARVQSRPANRALAEWMCATNIYHTTREGHAPYAGETLKLWKQKTTIGADGTHHSRIIEVDAIDPNDHAVLGFNGVSGMHAAQKNLHGFFEQMAHVLGGDMASLTPIGGKKLTLYAVTYPDAHRIRYAQEIPALNADPEHYTSSMVQAFTKRVLLPWLGLKEGDAPLDVADLKQRMRRLNFFSIAMAHPSAKRCAMRCASGCKRKAMSKARFASCLLKPMRSLFILSAVWTTIIPVVGSVVSMLSRAATFR